MIIYIIMYDVITYGFFQNSMMQVLVAEEGSGQEIKEGQHKFKEIGSHPTSECKLTIQTHSPQRRSQEPVKGRHYPAFIFCGR